MVPIRLHMWLNWLYNASMLMDLPQQGRSMKVAIGISWGLLMGEEMACLKVKCMISSS